MVIHSRKMTSSKPVRKASVARLICRFSRKLATRWMYSNRLPFVTGLSRDPGSSSIYTAIATLNKFSDLTHDHAGLRLCG